MLTSAPVRLRLRGRHVGTAASHEGEEPSDVTELESELVSEST